MRIFSQHVFSNVATSVDGKINTAAQDRLALGSDEDRRMMSVLRAQADAVFVGGNTMRRWGLPLIENPQHLDAPVQRDRPVVNAVLSRRGILDMSPRRWPDPRVQLVVLGQEGIDVEAHQRRFGAEVLTTAEPTVSWALDVLAARGCRSVLVEGGGDLIFQLLEADRLDEMYITLCPLIIGGATAPTPADGPGFPGDQLRRLRLADSRQVGDELYLRYTVDRR